MELDRGKDLLVQEWFAEEGWRGGAESVWRQPV
jgi:hypothetical protein